MENIREWSAETGMCTNVFFEKSGDVFINAVYSRDNKKLLFTSAGGRIGEIEVESGKLINSFIGHLSVGRVLVANYINEEKEILTYSSDGFVKIWKLDTLECTNEYKFIPGLSVEGAIFKNLHKESDLNEYREPLVPCKV